MLISRSHLVNAGIPLNALLICVLLILFHTSQAQRAKILWTCNWSHNDSYIAVGGGDGILRIFDGDSFGLIHTDTLGESIERLRWHPEKNVLAIAGFGKVSRLIDFEDNSPKILAEVETGSRSIAWNSVGNKLALADYEGNILFYDEAGNLINKFGKENTRSNTAITWHPTKEEVIVLSDDVRHYKSDGTLIHKYRNRKEEVLLLCTEWHQKHQFYVVGDYGRPDEGMTPLLQFWSADHKLIYESDISKAEFRNINWNRKGKRLATASDQLRIWNRKGKMLKSGSIDELLWGVHYSQKGKYILTTSEKGSITLWNRKAKRIRSLKF